MRLKRLELYLDKLTLIPHLLGRGQIFTKKLWKIELKLTNLPITSPWQLPNTYSSYHLYPICIEDDKNAKLQQKIYYELHDNGIAVNLHYIPAHRQPYYESFGFKEGDFLESEKFHRKVISLPIFPSLKKRECDKVISVISKVFQDSVS